MKLKLLHILFIIILLMPTGSYALGILFDINNANNLSDDPVVQAKQFSKICSNIIVPTKITGNVVRCANAIINYGGDRIIGNFVKPFSTIVYYALIIAVVFHGIQMMYGVARSQANLMMVAKIVLVLFFCGPDGYFFLKSIRNVLIGFPKNISSSLVADPGSTHPKMIESPVGSGIWIQDTTASGQPAVEHDITMVGFILDISGIKGMLCKPNGDLFIPSAIVGLTCPSYRMEDFYDKFDESVLKIFGVSDSDIAAKQKDPQQFMGVIVLAAGLLFTGGWGTMFVVEILLLATATLFAIAQMALFFIIVAVAINVLVAITPLALACLLFESTKGITKRWFNYLIVYSVQPILLVAFMVITVTVLKKATDEYTRQSLSDKVNMNLLNADALPNNGITLFNCFGSSSSSDIVTRQLGDTENYDTLMALASKQNFFNAVSVTGNVTASGTNDQTTQRCKLKAFSFKIQEPIYGLPTTANTEKVPCNEGDPGCYEDSGNWYQYIIKDNKISPQYLRSILAINLAIIILQLILLSFLKQMPKMVARIVNAGGIETAVDIATRPTDQYVPGVVKGAGSAVRGISGANF